MPWLRITFALVIILLVVACAHDTEWLSRAVYTIISIDTDEDYFVINGDFAEQFEVEGEITVTTTDDAGVQTTIGTFTVTGASTLMGTTRIAVEEDIPDTAAGGIIQHVAEGDSIPDPTEVVLYFSTKAEFDPSVWYYIVFNFSQATNTTVPSSGVPAAELSDDLRGENWEMYILLHRDENGMFEMSTHRPTRLPSLLTTDPGPADATAADFNSDGRQDIAVACSIEGTVELTLAEELDIYEEPELRNYWIDTVDIPAGAGPTPLRIHATDLTGDELDDLLVLYAGSDSGNGTLRVLAVDDNDSDGKGDGTFQQAGADLPLGITPVDWLCCDHRTGDNLDFNDDGLPDVAILGTNAGGGVVLIATSDAAGVFTLAGTYPVGSQPAALAGGVLAGDTFDLVAGCNSGTGGTGEAHILTADEAGVFTAGPVLAVEAPLTCVNVGRMLGSVADVIVTYNSGDEATAAVFLNEEDSFFTTDATSVSYTGAVQYVLPHDSSSDTRNDLVIVDGVPGERNNKLIIVERDSTQPSELRWEQDVVTYLQGEDPSRIILVDLDGDDKRDDFIITNSANNAGGNSISLVYGLGKNNYTNIDRYWTDQNPQILTTQEWYLRHLMGPNSFQLVIDPRVFYDLAETEIDRFIVDFMTGTSAIDWDRNRDEGGSEQVGEIIENLTSPINVSVLVDYLEEEITNNLVNDNPANEAGDIDNWYIEVN